jgi:predicted transport protein
MTMPLYRIDNQLVYDIRIQPFRLEKDLQSIVEANLSALLNLELVKSEFSIRQFRIDTLAYDKESKAFIIIEYKRDQHKSVIDQGFAYLALLLNNKADFILEYNEQLGRNMKRDEIDWSQSRVLFMAPSFTDFQRESINFRDLPIELYEARLYEGGVFTFNQVQKIGAKETIKTISKGNVAAEQVAKEVKVYSETDHLQGISEGFKELYELFKERVLSLGQIDIVPRKQYIAFKSRKNVVDVLFKKAGIKVMLNLRVGQLHDPSGLARNVSKVGHWGNGDYRVVFDSEDQLDDVMQLVKQSYKANS